MHQRLLGCSRGYNSKASHHQASEDRAYSRHVDSLHSWFEKEIYSSVCGGDSKLWRSRAHSQSK